MSVFFTSRKTGFKSWLDTSSIPCCLSSFFSFFLSQSWQLLDTRWINREWVCILDSFSTPGGSIELLFLDLIPCCSILAWYLNYRRPFSRYLIYLVLLKVLFKPPHAIQFSFHSISFSITLCFLSQTLSSHSNFIPQRFLQDFSSLSSLGKLLISHSSCISCFWDLGFEVFENFRVFSKLLSYSWNFGMGFHLNEFKTSYTTSH